MWVISSNVKASDLKGMATSWLWKAWDDVSEQTRLGLDRMAEDLDAPDSLWDAVYENLGYMWMLRAELVSRVDTVLHQE